MAVLGFNGISKNPISPAVIARGIMLGINERMGKMKDALTYLDKILEQDAHDNGDDQKSQHKTHL